MGIGLPPSALAMATAFLAGKLTKGVKPDAKKISAERSRLGRNYGGKYVTAAKRAIG